MRTSISTSDSDVSPHTSTVVENGILHSGWSSTDATLKIPPGNKRGSSGNAMTLIVYTCTCIEDLDFIQGDL